MYESGENYLETILILEKKNDIVKSVDIARKLGFSKPSVSRAVNILKNEGYIEIESTGNILMTKEGKKKAEDIYERHQVITEFLKFTTQVSPQIAEEDACRMEHIISKETFLGIKRFVQQQNVDK